MMVNTCSVFDTRRTNDANPGVFEATKRSHYLSPEPAKAPPVRWRLRDFDTETLRSNLQETAAAAEEEKGGRESRCEDMYFLQATAL